MITSSIRMSGVCASILFCAIAGTACTHQAPTIAHIHVGHAITGAHDTHGRVGYLTLATQHATDALEHANSAVLPGRELALIKDDVAAANAVTNAEGSHPLTVAVREAADHIEFAAMSNDVSDNIKAGYQKFKATIEGVLYRAILIERYAGDVASSTSEADARLLAQEIAKLAHANVHGEDLDNNGSIGTTPREYGLDQIGRELDALVAREDPPYVTVDRWYLFNLIRLPSGEWIFKRSGSSGSRGY